MMCLQLVSAAPTWPKSSFYRFMVLQQKMKQQLDLTQHPGEVKMSELEQKCAWHSKGEANQCWISQLSAEQGGQAEVWFVVTLSGRT